MTGNQRRDNEEAYVLAEQAKQDECSVIEDEHPHPGLDLLPNGMPRDVGSDLQNVWPEEMYVPGLVIHLVKDEEPSEQSTLQSFCSFIGCCEESQAQYSAVLKDRQSFQDIVVSPNMFIDHAPWRCQRAMDEVLKKWGRIPVMKASVYPELASGLV